MKAITLTAKWSVWFVPGLVGAAIMAVAPELALAQQEPAFCRSASLETVPMSHRQPANTLDFERQAHRILSGIDTMYTSGIPVGVGELLKHDSVATFWALAGLIADSWGTSQATADAATSVYRSLRGDALPILVRMRSNGDESRYANALTAIDRLTGEEEHRAVQVMACYASTMLRTVPDDLLPVAQGAPFRGVLADAAWPARACRVLAETGRLASGRTWGDELIRQTRQSASTACVSSTE